MISLPRLNQTFDYYIVSREGSRGQFTKTLGGLKIPCRFSTKTGTFRDNRGQDIEFTAQIHTGVTQELKKGHCVSFNCNDYIILDVTKTADLQGNFFMQYCHLKEYAFA